MKKFFLIICTLLAFKAQAATSELSPEWLALVHYRPQLLGGYEGTIDSETFYLSEKGRKSPENELKATIELFNDGKDIEKICLFPARYKYLKKQGLVTTKFPKCDEYEQFVKDLQPDGVTLLFTDAYMNNPSSLFGHSLIRIDTARKGTQLLAHGLNYGAFTGPNPGALYPILGIFGGYYGGFTVKPYYDIINTYNNIENRDIWELKLDFTPEEKEMFVAHIWEVGQTKTSYYFFTKNCSYMLMETLDAVRPSLKLADEFYLQTIPLDTIKAVYRRKGLVKEVNYRPSRQAQIVSKYEQMNDKQKKAYAAAILEEDFSFSDLNEAEKAGVAETAYQFVQYQNVAAEISKEDYLSRSFKLLKIRSQLSVQDNLKSLDEAKEPMKSHESMRAGMGIGSRNGEAFQELAYRPAYHSLTDNAYGFLSGAEINFLSLKARHYDNQNNYVLQDFDIIGIKSLAPRNVMFSPLSYNIQWGVNREINPYTDEEGYVMNLAVASGVTYEVYDDIYAFVMINNHAAYGGFLPHNQYLGMGGLAGVYASFEKIHLLAQVEKIYATTNYGMKTKYDFEATYSLTTNTSAALNYKYEDTQGKYDLDETMLSLRYHF